MATVKDYILIITEKPQAAQKIAQALGTPIKRLENGVPYYELTRNGKIITVASAVGHLFNLTYSAGQKGWPIFNLEWQPSYSRKTAAFTKKYYEVLKRLVRSAETFIVATDFDVEGEVIGWNVVRFIGKRTNALRMKFSTLTNDELENSYENPMSELNWGNAYAGETRHFLDWLYGINLSRALMSAIKQTGSFKVLSIGRVQGPALKIIADREKEISAFKPEPYWQIFALAESIEFKHPKDIFDKSLLEQFKDIKEANAETEKNNENISPPVPFDLTTLQREAYRLFKMNPSETLATTQKLYLEGIISYPRTSSQKIPEAIQPKKILKALAKHFPQVKEATREKPVEGKKSDPAHPSIYPTGEYRKLVEKEEKIYNLIVQRFIAAFCKDAVAARKHIILTAKNGITFTANATTLSEKGWMKVYPSFIEESSLPDLNGLVKIDENLTRELEEELEKIQESKKEFMEQEQKVIKHAREIITKISEEFKQKEKEIGEELLQGLQTLRQEQNESNTLLSCPTCKKGNLRILYSKKTKRYFVACSAYPDCKQTYSLPPNALIKKSDKLCEADQFPKLLAIRKGKRPWEFCFNPNCPIEKKKREEWQARKASNENPNSNLLEED